MSHHNYFKLSLFILFLSISSCVYTENITPEQEFYVSFKELNSQLNFRPKIKGTIIDTLPLSKESDYYRIKIPELRWGETILIGLKIKSHDPENAKDLFAVNKDGAELYGLSLSEIKKFEYLMIDSRQIFILHGEIQN